MILVSLTGCNSSRLEVRNVLLMDSSRPDANPAAYKHTVAYKHVSAEPQATSTESNNLEPCPYRYDANKTAVHLTCSVKAFYTAPDKPMIQTTGPLGPLSVWEPHFDVTRCKPGDLEKFKEACKMFDVIAPTHVDLMKLFGAEEKEDLWGSLLKRFKDDSDSSKADKKRARALIEWHAEKLLRSGVGRRNAGTVVVRSGELGCLVATRLPGKWIKISFEWLPDYLDEFFGSMDYLEHPPAKEYLPNSPQVGTMFVGALTYGMATGWPVVEAAKRALFAATYLVQLEKCRTEKWNAKMRISKDEWERVWEQGRVTPHDLQPEPAGAAPGEAWLGHCFEWRALLWDSPGYGSRASDTPSEPTLFDRLTKLATPQ